MSDGFRALIAAVRNGELEERLRQAAARFGEEGLDGLEARHLARVLTNPSLVLTSVLDLIQFSDLVDVHLYPTALRALAAEDGDEAALHRVLAVPDHVRVLGDKCLFEIGVARRKGPKGLDLVELGRRSYHKSSVILGALAEDKRLRRFYEENALNAVPIDEEIAFLDRCAERFPLHARLLDALLFQDDPSALTTSAASPRDATRAPVAATRRPRTDPEGESGTVRSSTAALAPPPAGPAEPVRRKTRPEDEADGPRRLVDLKLVGRTDEERHEAQVRDLIAAERTVLFSALDTELLRDELKKVVIQQENAIDSLCDELSLYSTGTQDPRKPASYFLCGPTGVGKNYLVESLCQLFEDLWGIEVPYLELEGPEFTYPSDINELKGAARGFIRSDEEGIMTQFHERAHDKPFSVILIDEVEKSHPQLRRFFLPIMDRGTMMDNRGRVLHFSNTTIFFTSNMGYSDAAQRPKAVGFGDEEAKEHSDVRFVEQQVRRSLSPEFINRVHFVHFEHLEREAVDRIFDLEMSKIRRRYRDAQDLEVRVSERARTALLELGYSREYGARNLAKALNRHANIEVSKALKRDEGREFGDVSEVVSLIRDMREGRVNMDLDEVRQQVESVSRIRVPYRCVTIDHRDGDFVYDRE